MKNYLTVCVTCLSRDRHLVALYKIKHFLQDLHFLELETCYGAICWECQSIIMKFHKFKEKALKAQASLYKKEKVETMKPLTCLGIKFNISWDHDYYYSNFDPLSYHGTEPTVDKNTVKVAPNECIDYEDNIDAENFNTITPTMYDDGLKYEEKVNVTENIEHVHTEKLDDTGQCMNSEHVHIEELDITKKCIKTNKAAELKTIEKFIKVVLSEEEMLKNREIKRNHRNFKKLPFKCDSCVLGFTRKDTFEMHAKTKHAELSGPFVCDVCKVGFTLISTMSHHRAKHYTRFKCLLCKYTTTEEGFALKHCKLKHVRDQLDCIHCDQCDAVVKSPQELEEHAQKTHCLYCNECGIRFKKNGTLKRHKAHIHGVKREFICDICTRRFVTKSRLESHIVSHSTNLAKKLAYCHKCNVQYKNIYVYRNHLRNSAKHLEKTYTCPNCDKKFTSQVYMTNHYNFHHLHKSKHKCELCNKLFVSDWRLKYHKQTRHGLARPKNHSCDNCGKKFFTIAMLRNHQLTHSEQRSYMCEDCGDTFKQRPALYTHVKLVHGKRRK